MRSLAAPIIVAALILAPLAAFAQDNPSASQIINSLKPSGNMMMGGTRGIRLAPTNETPAPQTATPSSAQHPHVAATTAPTAAPPGGPAVNLTVNFATGSAELTPEAVRTLDELGQALSSQDLAAYRFRIEGKTLTLRQVRNARGVAVEQAASFKLVRVE